MSCLLPHNFRQHLHTRDEYRLRSPNLISCFHSSLFIANVNSIQWRHSGSGQTPVRPSSPSGPSMAGPPRHRLAGKRGQHRQGPASGTAILARSAIIVPCPESLVRLGWISEFRIRVCESQRDSNPKPKVAPNALGLPYVVSPPFSTATRLWPRSPIAREANGHNPVGVVETNGRRYPG